MLTKAKDVYLWCVDRIAEHPHLTFWAGAGIVAALVVVR